MKRKNEKRLYFAFGSNLRHSQMKRRCPHSKYICSAKVNGIKVVFRGYSIRWRGSPATIIDSPSSDVWGAVYELDRHCVRRLDKLEGLTTHRYHHKLVSCQSSDGHNLEAYTYVGRRRSKEGLPSKKYLSQIVKGAKECELPSSYIKKLESALK